MDTKQMYNAYLVYSDGRVQNKNTGRFLKLETTHHGYKRVTLSHEGKTTRYSVHRLVASFFIPNPENKPCVNHIDGNSANNDVSNLEWCTFSENEYHSYRALGKQVPKGINRWNARFTDEDIENIIAYAKVNGCRAAGRLFQCSHQYVSDLVRANGRAK